MRIVDVRLNYEGIVGPELYRLMGVDLGGDILSDGGGLRQIVRCGAICIGFRSVCTKYGVLYACTVWGVVVGLCRWDITESPTCIEHAGEKSARVNLYGVEPPPFDRPLTICRRRVGGEEAHRSFVIDDGRWKRHLLRD